MPGAQPFDVLRICIVAFQCNKNLAALPLAIPLPAQLNFGNAPDSAVTLGSRSRSFGSEFHLTVTGGDGHCLSRLDFPAQEFHGQRVLNQRLNRAF